MHVELTWNNKGKVITESVFAVSPDVSAYDADYKVTSVEELMASTGSLLFEDDFGFFFVEPDEIIDIKEL